MFQEGLNFERMYFCIANIDPSMKGDLSMVIRCLKNQLGSLGERRSSIVFELVELYLLGGRSML